MYILRTGKNNQPKLDDCIATGYYLLTYRIYTHDYKMRRLETTELK